MVIRGRFGAAGATSAAPHGYTLALWTATAVTSSDRGAPGTAEVLALLAGATLAFVGLSVVAYGGSPFHLLAVSAQFRRSAVRRIT
jgi:hypothetical protein